MTLVLAAAVLGAVAAPHVLRLRHAPPAVAALLWSSALVLRALTSVFAAIFVVFFLPATQLFEAVTRWCWHTVLPGLTAHLGVSGHNVGDVATVAPVFALFASALWVLLGIVRGARSVTRFVRRAGLGSGPQGSVIVGGPDVFVGAAGITRPRVVVSAGALTALDDDELAAGLAHERGHIARGHRYVLLAAELCRTLGRPLPGTRTVARELAFHLERDADEWALARRHDRLALAGAICKAALPRGTAPLRPTVAALAGAGAVGDRVLELVEQTPQAGPLRVRVLRTLGVSSAALAVAVAVAIGPAVAAGQGRPSGDVPIEHCRS